MQRIVEKKEALFIYIHILILFILFIYNFVSNLKIV